MVNGRREWKTKNICADPTITGDRKMMMKPKKRLPEQWVKMDLMR